MEESTNYSGEWHAPSRNLHAYGGGEYGKCDSARACVYSALRVRASIPLLQYAYMRVFVPMGVCTLLTHTCCSHIIPSPLPSAPTVRASGPRIFVQTHAQHHRRHTHAALRARLWTGACVWACVLARV